MNYGANGRSDGGISRQTDLEGEVSRVLVESAAVEEGEDVAADLGGEDAVAGERADAAVGEGRRHHRDRLAVHLHRTALRRENQVAYNNDIRLKGSSQVAYIMVKTCIFLPAKESCIERKFCLSISMKIGSV